jgi:UDP-N-acetylmuramoyl-L-alanine---L-glutamate ligase
MDTHRQTLKDLAGRSIAIWGYGRDTKPVVAALLKLTPRPHVSIISDAALDATSSTQLTTDGVHVYSDSPTSVLASRLFDVIIRSPGVSTYRSELQAARQRDVTVTTTTNLWFAEWDGARNIVGVTGTKGKSTTTSLIAHMLAANGLKSIACGNIGVPLFGNAIEKDATAVVELSSYMLADFTGRVPVGLLLNLFPEHLDWHGDRDRYFSDKKQIFARQHAGDIAILPVTLLQYGDVLSQSRRVVYFGTRDGFHVVRDSVYHRDTVVCSGSTQPLRGSHNLRNIAAALTVVHELGVDVSQSVESLSSFVPLAHRLQPVGNFHDILFVNDSISTIPEATLAALESFVPQKVTLLIGGSDRGLDWSEFARELSLFDLNALVVLPDTGPSVASAIEVLRAGTETSRRFPVYSAADIDEAVTIASRVTPKSGVVLLSPGAPSYNAYKDFEARGQAFENAVLRMYGRGP